MRKKKRQDQKWSKRDQRKKNKNKLKNNKFKKGLNKQLKKEKFRRNNLWRLIRTHRD